jgi:hypothetical protein
MDEPEDALDEPSPIKYLVTTAQGEFVIELPPAYKLTFGAVNPGGNPQGMRGHDLHCLRIWERYTGSKADRLRAVFCDVRGFRDLSLPLARKIEAQSTNAEWRRDDLGNFEESSRRQIQSSWVTEYGPGQEPSEDDPF